MTLPWRVLVAALAAGPSAAHESAGAPSPPREIVVVASSDAAPYRAALEGFRRVAGERYPGVPVRILPSGSDGAALPAAVATARDAQPSLVLALGTRATRETLAVVGTTPVVAGLLLDAEEITGAPNATGVYLEHPVATELEWIRRTLPDRPRVGIVYHSDRNAARAAEAKSIAKSLDLAVHDVRIDSPEQLPAVLKGLRNRIDVLLGLADPVVYNGDTIRSILLFSFQNRIPVVGISTAWVRAGALYSLDRDYTDIGAQCAELAGAILSGRAPASLTARAPRKVTYALNRRTVAEMRLELPDTLFAGAAEVVQ